MSVSYAFYYISYLAFYDDNLCITYKVGRAVDDTTLTRANDVRRPSALARAVHYLLSDFLRFTYFATFFHCLLARD